MAKVVQSNEDAVSGEDQPLCLPFHARSLPLATIGRSRARPAKRTSHAVGIIAARSRRSRVYRDAGDADCAVGGSAHAHLAGSLSRPPHQAIAWDLPVRMK